METLLTLDGKRKGTAVYTLSIDYSWQSDAGPRPDTIKATGGSVRRFRLLKQREPKPEK